MNLFRLNGHAVNFQKQLQQKELIEQYACDHLLSLKGGSFGVPLKTELENTSLGAAISSIDAYLQGLAQDEQQRNWGNVGLAKFGDILRNKDGLPLKELANEILTNLVRYMDANQGAIFVLEGEGEDRYLEMLACYAYDRKKFLDKKINLGDGLAGQCVLEKDMINLTQIPDNYVSITSGLGGATPRELLISPLIINESVFGVLELASFTPFTEYKLQFAKRLSENIAASIRNVKESERVLALLNASQQQAESLRAQEEELRQNMEELKATQEEMERKTQEISRSSAEMVSIMKGINTTMATIEFTPDGTILNANENFLAAVRYRLSEIKDRHHSMFVPDDIKKSDDYAHFWERLSKGESISGVFKRRTSTGQVLWLNAIYNPIFNQLNQVVKVVKFATNITEQQEVLAESKGILEGINATMATITFKPDGTVLDANENFLTTMKYSLNQIKGQHHRMFVPDDVLASKAYETFWQRLAQGESIKGVFKRVSSDKQSVVLNAIYNPIRNADGVVVKIVKFATDITDQDHS